MRRSLLLLALFAVGCTTPNADDSTTYSPAVVDLHKITTTLDSQGIGHVVGQPGAVTGGHASGVWLVIMRNGPGPSPTPQAYRTLHLTAGTEIDSKVTPIASDGSFSETLLGSSTAPLQIGDELNATPMQGSIQVGFPVYTEIE
ncbi:MAG TPA: hypothetical protein V6D47_02505 [Oscillatoriaceae cyanobacterium]